MSRKQIFPTACAPGLLFVGLCASIALIAKGAPLVTGASLALVAPWIAGNAPLAAALLFVGLLPMVCSGSILVLAAAFYLTSQEKAAPLAPSSQPTQGLMALSNALGQTSVRPELTEAAKSIEHHVSLTR